MSVEPRPIVAHPDDSYHADGGTFLGHAGRNWDYYQHANRVVTIPVVAGCRASSHGDLGYWATTILRREDEGTLSPAGRLAFAQVYPGRAWELWQLDPTR